MRIKSEHKGKGNRQRIRKNISHELFIIAIDDNKLFNMGNTKIEYNG